MNDFKVYVTGDCQDPLTENWYIGWKATNADGQWGAVLKIPIENREEFINQLLLILKDRPEGFHRSPPAE